MLSSTFTRNPRWLFSMALAGTSLSMSTTAATSPTTTTTFNAASSGSILFATSPIATSSATPFGASSVSSSFSSPFGATGMEARNVRIRRYGPGMTGTHVGGRF